MVKDEYDFPPITGSFIVFHVCVGLANDSRIIVVSSGGCDVVGGGGVVFDVVVDVGLLIIVYY